LAIARPDLQITSLDSTDKKVQYVNQTAALLGISDRLHAITARAEDAAAPGMPLRESFDIVTGRAVAGLPLLAELCVPFLKVDGIFIAMKGGKAAEEMNEAANAYRTLGMTAAVLLPCRIHAPEADNDAPQESPEEHALVIARKAKKTPEIYPRKYARMLKKPL
jgi:16S rRNA (guanine527-N7)-methyltransferase